MVVNIIIFWLSRIQSLLLSWGNSLLLDTSWRVRSVLNYGNPRRDRHFFFPLEVGDTQPSPGHLETPMQSVTWRINAMMYWYTAMYHVNNVSRQGDRECSLAVALVAVSFSYCSWTWPWLWSPLSSLFWFYNPSNLFWGLPDNLCTILFLLMLGQISFGGLQSRTMIETNINLESLHWMG